MCFHFLKVRETFWSRFLTEHIVNQESKLETLGGHGSNTGDGGSGGQLRVR